MGLVCQSCVQQMRKLVPFQIAGKLQCTPTYNGFKQVQITYLAVISNLDKLAQPSDTLSMQVRPLARLALVSASLGASLSCLVAWCGVAWLSERVGSVHAHMHYACTSLPLLLCFSAPVFPLPSYDCLVPYVSAVLSLVAPMSLRLSDACVVLWHAGV